MGSLGSLPTPVQNPSFNEPGGRAGCQYESWRPRSRNPRPLQRRSNPIGRTTRRNTPERRSVTRRRPIQACTRLNPRCQGSKTAGSNIPAARPSSIPPSPIHGVSGIHPRRLQRKRIANGGISEAPMRKRSPRVRGGRFRDPFPGLGPLAASREIPSGLLPFIVNREGLRRFRVAACAAARRVPSRGCRSPGRRFRS